MVKIVWVICLRCRPHTRVDIVDIVEMVEMVEIVWVICLEAEPTPEWK